MNNRTTSYKPGDIERKWYVVDAAGIPVGRLAAQVSQVLRGKNKPNFVYNADCGDFVIVINADKAVLTGGKADEVIYWHSGFPGGLKNVARGKMLEEKPEMLIEKAVWGMMPKTKLGKAMVKKLKVFAGPTHNHEAQQPEPLDIRKDK
jgi:large subunit ribosomal protein L13